MNMDQALPASEARAPGFAIGDTDYRNRPAGKSPRPPGMEPTLIWICFSRHQLRIPITSERLNVQRHPEVCSDVMTLLAFIHDVASRRELVGAHCLGAHRMIRKSLALSRSSWGASLPFMLITRFAQNPVLSVFLSQTHSQEIVAVGNRIENLLSRVVILEEHLNSRPSDVADQRHRDELIWYVAIPPLLLALILF